jgi:aldehyde dehydrogenase (NAD+)
MTETYHNYVDGEWVEGEGGTYEVVNPADTDDVVGEFQLSSAADAEHAIEVADAAQADWAATPGPERGALLQTVGELLADRKEVLAETLTREEGKTVPEATGEVQRAIDIFHYYAEKTRDYRGTVKNPSATDKDLYTVQEPLGVASLVAPWNYPIAIPAWKLAPALAVGNSVVFKPATAAPTVTAKLFECLDEAGIPDGVVNYVSGSGSDIGDTLTKHELVDVVSFTGSAEVGHMVYADATEDMKRVQTEMGGKNPTLVMPSADVGEAADIVARGAFGVTGQACTACSRAIVHEAVYEEFVDALVAEAEAIEVGPGLDGADMGPQVNERELEGTLDYIEVGQTEGATLASGGDRIEGEGWFVEPTVFTDVEPDMRIAQEEIFGPVVAVIPVAGYEEAIDVANDVDYGLSASIVTDDLTEAHRFVEESESGVAKVNEKTTGLELHVPFGGYKDSSSNTYREQGDAALDFFTSTKTVYLNY